MPRTLAFVMLLIHMVMRARHASSSVSSLFICCQLSSCVNNAARFMYFGARPAVFSFVIGDLATIAQCIIIHANSEDSQSDKFLVFLHN
jgi:hypothetical protein